MFDQRCQLFSQRSANCILRAGCVRAEKSPGVCVYIGTVCHDPLSQAADEDLTEAQQAAIMKAGRERARRERLNDR